MSDESVNTPQAPATSPNTQPQMVMVDRDLEHLKLLSILWYVIAGLNALGGCFAVFYIALGAIFMAAPPTGPASQPGAASQSQQPPPELLGGMFIGLGGCLMIFALGVAVLAFITAGSLRKQKRRTFCMVMAGVVCLSVPIGTVLGVFTLIVLARPTVAALFARNAGALHPA